MRSIRTHGLFFVASLLLVAASLATFRPAVVVQKNLAGATVPVVAFVGGARQGVNLFFHKLNLHMQAVREKEWLLQEFNQQFKLKHQLLVLETENKQLRKLLNMAGEVSGEPLAARVLVDSAGPFQRSLLLNVGANQGVLRGQAVLSDGGLVGRVVDVFPEFSRVLLLTDYTFRLPVRVLENAQQAMMRGESRTTMKIFLQQEEVPLTVGMHVVTSGVDGVFAPNLPVGVISKVAGSDILVRPYFQAAQLNFVTIQRRPVHNIVPENVPDVVPPPNSAVEKAPAKAPAKTPEKAGGAAPAVAPQATGATKKLKEANSAAPAAPQKPVEPAPKKPVNLTPATEPGEVL